MSAIQPTHAFFGRPRSYPGSWALVDLVHPATGRGVYSGEDEAAIGLRYADLERLPIDEGVAKADARMVTLPEEITAEKFMEMLEVLPPKGWARTQETETFQMIEHLSGNITGTYARIGKRCFSWYDRAGLPPADRIRKARAAAGAA